MTKHKVEELLSKTGHQLCFADFELVSGLDEIAGRVYGIFDGHERAVHFPVEVESICLYPLTIAKSEMVAENDFDESEFVYLLSMPNDVPTLPPAKQLKREASKQWKSMSCTEEELAEAIQNVISMSEADTEEDDADAKKKSDWPAIIDLLCSEYGSTPKYWMYEESLNLIVDLMSRITDRKQQNSSTEAGKAPIPTKRLASILEFKQKAVEILEIWGADNG